MNKDRRKRLENAAEMLQQLIDEISAIHDEEEDALANMPESLQSSERGEQMYTIYTTLEEVSYSLEEAQSSLEEAMEC